MSKSEMPKAYESASIEEKWYSSWENNRLFHGEPKPGKKPYSIVIPPPNVTGILTMGHVLNNTLQDILIRWHRMMARKSAGSPAPTTPESPRKAAWKNSSVKKRESDAKTSDARSSSSGSGPGANSTAEPSSANSANWEPPATGSASVSPWTKGSPTPSTRSSSSSTTRATSIADAA